MNKIFVHLARAAFGGLIIFEILNYFKILNFKVDFTWLGLISTAIAIWIGLEFVERFLQKTCQSVLPPAIWFTVIFAVYFDALGDILHFYSRFIWYDQTAHFIGSAVAGLVLFFILKTVNQCKKFAASTWVIYLLIFTIVTSLGVLYEVDEYLEDYFQGTNRLGDGPDTVNDLLFDMLGGLLVILSIIIIQKIRKFKVKTLK